MNIIDLGLIGLFLMSFFYGYHKGFIKQAVGLVGLLLSLVIAYSFSDDTAVFLQQTFPLPESSNSLLQALLGIGPLHQILYSIVAFILLFLLSRLLCSLAGRVLQMFAELPVISWINRGLGGMLGFLQLCLLLLVAVNIMEAAPDGKWKKAYYESNIAQIFHDISPLITERLKLAPKPERQFHEPSDIL